MSDRFGLELLWELVKKDFVRKSDAVVAFVHWKLISNELYCVGLGEDFGGAKEINPTELLPSGWNSSGESAYVLKYRHSKTNASKFVFKSVRVVSDDPKSPYELILVRVADEIVKTMTVIPDDVIDDDYSIKKDEIFKDVQENIIKEFLPREPRTQTETRPTSSTRNPTMPEPSGMRPLNPLGPLGIGQNDLNPLGGGIGGGMIFDPLRDLNPRGGGGYLPRFDPPGPMFGPGMGGPRFPGMGSGRGGRGRGNFGDDLPPPGFDDMFM